jgi:hypothetical protein
MPVRMEVGWHMLSHPFALVVSIAVAIPVAVLVRGLYGRSRASRIAVTAGVLTMLAAAIVIAVVIR